jgi:hypothetical protein
MNKLMKDKGHQIIIKKALVFLQTDNELLKMEIEKIIPLTIASKGIKYFGINLTKEVKSMKIKK